MNLYSYAPKKSSLSPLKWGEGKGEGFLVMLLTPALSSFSEEREKTSFIFFVP